MEYEVITKKLKLDPSSNSAETKKALFYNIYEPSEKVQCVFCDKEITRYTKIQDGEYPHTRMCVNCFVEEKQDNKYPRSDTYHIVNKLSFPIYEDNWTAEEEVLLIEGLEKFGFGNWGDISDHLSTDKTPEDVELHYEKVFLDNSDHLFPERVLSRRDDEFNLQIQQADGSAKSQMEIDMKKKKGVKPGNEKKSAGTGGMKSQGGLQLKDSGINGAEIVGYMPLRGDFDYEYDNEAELFLAELEFNDDDRPEETATKMKILEVYNLRLDERIKRKKFVIERDMLDLKKQNLLDMMRSKEEKEIWNLLKVFARFHSPEQHERLVQGIYREKLLRQKIEELRMYKKMGLKTFEEVELLLKEKRNKDENYQKKVKQAESIICEAKVKNANGARRTRNQLNGYDSKDQQEKKNKHALAQMNEKEYNLCETLDVMPYEFLLIKDLLVRECLAKGFLTKDEATGNVKIDYKEQTEIIFDFLVTNKVILAKN